MPKYHSVTISFKPDSIHLYEFLKSKDNMSAYILQLISNDMESVNNVTLKQTIKEVVLEVLNECDISINGSNNTSQEVLDDDEMSIINDYF